MWSCKQIAIALKNTELAQAVDVVSLENLHFDYSPKQAIVLFHFLWMFFFLKINRKHFPCFTRLVNCGKRMLQLRQVTFYFVLFLILLAD